jgi:hypothetical protein
MLQRLLLAMLHRPDLLITLRIGLLLLLLLLQPRSLLLLRRWGPVCKLQRSQRELGAHVCSRACAEPAASQHCKLLCMWQLQLLQQRTCCAVQSVIRG